MKAAKPPSRTLDGKHAPPQSIIEIAITATMSNGVAELCVRAFIVSYT